MERSCSFIILEKKRYAGGLCVECCQNMKYWVSYPYLAYVGDGERRRDNLL